MDNEKNKEVKIPKGLQARKTQGFIIKSSQMEKFIAKHYGHLYNIAEDVLNHAEGENLVLNLSIENVSLDLPEWDEMNITDFKEQGAFENSLPLIMRDLVRENVIPAGIYDINLFQ